MNKLWRSPAGLLRFERSGRYCELRRTGTRIIVRRGPIEPRALDPETTEVRTSAWVSEAVRQLAGLIDKLRADGWTQVEWTASTHGLVVEPSPVEAALIEAPSRDLWAVHGDWLAARGDVRAELIALTLAIDECQPTDVERLQVGYAEQLARVQSQWFGELAEQSDLLRWRWSHGYLRELEFGGVQLDLDRHAPSDLLPMLVELLGHPCARLLARLALGSLERRGRREITRVLGPLIDARLPALRRLELGPGRIGNLASLAGLPELRALRVRGELVGLPGSTAARLEHLELELATLDIGLVEGLLAGAWPNLRRLWIVSERNDPWASLPLAKLGAMFEQLIVGGRVCELGIQGSTGLHALLERDDLARLAELRVHRARDVDAEVLLGQHAKLRGVAKIVIENPQLQRTQARLRDRFAGRLEVVRGR